MIRTFFFTSILFMSLVFLPSSSNAFIFIRGDNYLKGARPTSAAPIWPERTIKFLINENMTVYNGSIVPTLPVAKFKFAVENAIQAWASACKSDVKVELVGTTDLIKDPNDDINVIVWDNRTTAEGNVFSDPSVLAAATSVLSENTFNECDIVVNGEFSGTFETDASQLSGKYDLVSTLTHEIGHCLGLDHPVEPSGNPAYTSTNPILLQSTMVQTAVAGGSSTFRRTLDQDDRDAVQCMYERGRDFRDGLSCSSFHGTKDLSAITGTVTGGAKTEENPVICGTESAASSTSTPLKSTDSCIGTAEASPHSYSKTKPFYHFLFSSWGWISLLVTLRILNRLKKKQTVQYRSLNLFLSTLLLMGMISRTAVADTTASESHYFPRIDLVFEDHLSKPQSLQWFANIREDAVNWTTTPSNPAFKNSMGFTLRAPVIQEGSSTNSSWEAGIKFRYLLSQSILSSATTSGSNIFVQKKTSFNHLLGGSFFRWSPWGTLTASSSTASSTSSSGFKVFPFLQVDLGLGPISTTQVIQGSSQSSLKAQGWSLETALQIGALVPITSFLSSTLAVGYSRERSNYLKVSSVSGTHYSHLQENSSIEVTDGSQHKSLAYDLSGLTLNLGISIHL